MPGDYTANWSPFPPETREVPCDEKWAFVGKKEQHCDAEDPQDQRQGDNWDHVAYDPEHRLVLGVVPKRTGKPGHPRHPYQVPPKDLTYATVHKTRKKGRVVRVDYRLIFGTREALQAALAKSAVTYYTMYQYNFCWPLRTLRLRREDGSYQPRPPMAAGLADHVWSLQEWLTYPCAQPP
jgi:hypothetical protein